MSLLHIGERYNNWPSFPSRVQYYIEVELTCEIFRNKVTKAVLRFSSVVT